MNDVECPYCGAEMEIDGEDGLEEDQTHQKECPKCGKVFTYSVSICFYFYPEKAPCLNDEAEHQWKQIVGSPEKYFIGKQRCSVCDEERQI